MRLRDQVGVCQVYFRKKTRRSKRVSRVFIGQHRHALLLILETLFIEFLDLFRRLQRFGDLDGLLACEKLVRLEVILPCFRLPVSEALDSVAERLRQSGHALPFSTLLALRPATELRVSRAACAFAGVEMLPSIAAALIGFPQCGHGQFMDTRCLLGILCDAHPTAFRIPCIGSTPGTPIHLSASTIR